MGGKALGPFSLLALEAGGSLMSSDSHNQSWPTVEAENGALVLVAAWQHSCFL